MFQKSLPLFLALAITLIAGVAIGLVIPWNTLRDGVSRWIQPDPVAKSTDPAGDDHSADHIELSETAQTGMGLKTGRLDRSDYQATYRVPAFVRELPGASDLRLDSRFEGVISRLLVSEGQTVSAGHPVYEIELTDQSLIVAQADLLDALQQIGIVNLEIERLEPRVRSGGVASKTLLEARYQKQRLEAQVQTRTQELLLRGLSQGEIDGITENRKLVRKITVSVPEGLIPPQLNGPGIRAVGPEQFIVEKLLIKPGAMARPGDSICTLSWHAVLAIEGNAYENDLPRLRDLLASGEPIGVSVGPDDEEEILSARKIAWVSNHVDEETNTYPFYLYLDNEVVFDNRQADPDGSFVAWKWKPGQRAHIRIPDRKFSQVFLVPDDAVAVDGLRNFVFRWNGLVDHDHGADEPDHEHFDEFQAIEVPVIHRDQEFAIIELPGTLRPGDRIAFNHAAQLMFALKTGSGGGHAHGHGHSHGPGGHSH